MANTTSIYLDKIISAMVKKLIDWAVSPILHVRGCYIELADKSINNGKLKLARQVDMRFTYHDLCSISRLLDPWIPWKGGLGWFQGIEMGQQGYPEFLIYWDQDEDTTGIDQYHVEASKMNIRERFYTGLHGHLQPLYLTGPMYGPNHHKWLFEGKR